MSFTSKPGTYLWGNDYSWETCGVKGNAAKLSVISGQLKLDSFSLEGLGTKWSKDQWIDGSSPWYINSK